MVQYELYRRSSLGITLTDVLDEFIQKQLLSAQLAMRVLTQFDRIMSEALSERVRARSSLKGHLHTYRFFDDVWKFILRKCTIKIDDRLLHVDEVKIVACKKLD
jgi:transcription initiation factor TFIIA small subunit